LSPKVKKIEPSLFVHFGVAMGVGQLGRVGRYTHALGLFGGQHHIGGGSDIAGFGNTIVAMLGGKKEGEP
jgi:hypothetical protein